jgi:hypothetical protein
MSVSRCRLQVSAAHVSRDCDLAVGTPKHMDCNYAVVARSWLWIGDLPRIT